MDGNRNGSFQIKVDAAHEFGQKHNLAKLSPQWFSANVYHLTRSGGLGDQW